MIRPRVLEWLVALAFASGAAAQCPDDCPDAMLPGVPSGTGAAASYAQRRSGTEADASIKIGVTFRGLFKVTQPELVTAGLDASCMVGDDLRLYCRTGEVAVIVSGAGLWSTNDYLLFFGLGLDSDYSTTNVYWLGLAPGGQRMATRDAAPLAGVPVITATCRKVEYDPEALYRANYRPLDSTIDHWFANLVSGNTRSNFANGLSDPIGGRTGLVRVTVHGLGDTPSVNPDHRTQIYLNNTAIFTNLTYDDEVTATASVEFSSSLIGGNTATVGIEQVVQPGVTQTVFASGYLERYQLHYPRLLALINGRLTFGGSASSNNYLVDGFASTNGTILLDVTQPYAPVLLTNVALQVTPGGHGVYFGDTAPSAACYFAAHTGSLATVASIERVLFRDLAATNRQADYIVVCPYAFRTNAYTLLKYRDKDGLTVAVAPISDIYNEFGYGLADAGSLRQFLGYAYHHWQGPNPRYVVLAGDGTYDPKGNLGRGGNVIPVKLGPTPFSWTAQDNWFATVNGDDTLVDIALGRIPVTNDTGLAAVVGKIITYESLSSTNAWRSKTLAVADNNSDGIYFSGASDSNVVDNFNNGGYATTLSYLDLVPASVAYGIILTNLNAGRFAVNYFGHGSASQWAGENIWNVGDVNALTNGIWPLVTFFTCNNGAFHDPVTNCLAEAFLGRANRGAIACVAPSELSTEVYAEKLADGFYTSLAVTKESRLGDSLNAGLLALWQFNDSASELLCYEVFGDPALVMFPP